jgi:hypothetical protein
MEKNNTAKEKTKTKERIEIDPHVETVVFPSIGREEAESGQPG